MLTARDLEAVMQIDRKTIYAYMQRGLIPYFRIEWNVRFSKQEIVRWLEERIPASIGAWKGRRAPTAKFCGGHKACLTRRKQ